jgi:uncharacterized RDD family membrane protein YckC
MQPVQVPPQIPVPQAPPVRYAGFWRRFVAHMIDQIVVGIAAFVIFIPGLALLGVGIGAGIMEESESAMGLVLAAIAAYLVAIMLIVVGSWLYYALMESSSKQGTLGKLAIGIVVTDLSGNRISFGRATGRYFGKIISGMIMCIGYIMAGFTERKQALHDIMASCLVVLK